MSENITESVPLLWTDDLLHRLQARDLEDRFGAGELTPSKHPKETQQLLRQLHVDLAEALLESHPQLIELCTSLRACTTHYAALQRPNSLPSVGEDFLREVTRFSNLRDNPEEISF